MKFPYSFTYIISYRHSNERLNNLKRTLEWINRFTGAEIIVVEQDSHSKIADLHLACKHVFVKSKMPFNKAWGFNIGMKMANSGIIVFGDSDLIMDSEKFVSAVKMIEKYEMVNPYNSVIDLTPQESSQSLETISKISRPGRGETDIQKVPMCGGICIFRRDAIARIGGWHEDFIGWGGEDDFQSIKVKQFLTWHEQEAKCYHLHHDRPAPDMKWYQRNLHLLKKLSEMERDDLQKVIRTTAPRSGMKYKYDNY